LNLPAATIKRWEQQGKIPFKVIGRQIRFKQSEIIEWARAHDFTISMNDISQEKPAGDDFSLSGAVERGGVYFNIEGSDLKTVIENCVAHLEFIKDDLKAELSAGIIEREALAATGIGYNTAIPHTRNRLDFALRSADIPVFFLKNPIDFDTHDGEQVQFLFILITTNTREHLKMLAKISLLLKKETVINAMRQNDPDLAAIIKSVEDEEN